MIRYINTLTMASRNQEANLACKCSSHRHLMDNNLLEIQLMLVEALDRTQCSRLLVLLLLNIHHHLRCHRIKIELLLFLNCIHKSNKECQWAASKIQKAGFKDQIMNENKEEIQEQILEMLAVMNIEQVLETLAEMIQGQIPEWMIETMETIEMSPMKRAEITITKIKPITMKRGIEMPSSQAMIMQEIAIASLEASILKTCQPYQTYQPYKKS